MQIYSKRMLCHSIYEYTDTEKENYLKQGYHEVTRDDLKLYESLNYVYDFEADKPKEMVCKQVNPTEAEIQASLTAAVQNYMDTTVQARNYDNINSACTYANSTDHIFAAEGVACVKWRDAVWRKCYDMLAEVKAGTRAIPAAEEVIAELPALEW